MLTKINEVKSTTTITKSYFDKFPLVSLVVTKKEGDGAYSSRRIEPTSTTKCFDHEYLKQLVLVRAKYKKPCDLPYTIDTLSSGSSPDSESSVVYSVLCDLTANDSWEEFEKDINDYDFRIYDEEKTKQLQQKYGSKKPAVTSKVADVDSLAILESELDPDA